MYFCVNCMATKEDDVRDRINRLLAKALDDEFLVWLPKKEVKEKRGGKYEIAERPMFSGYLFLYWEGSDEKCIPMFELKRIPGLTRILCYDDGSHALKGKDQDFARWLHMNGGFIRQSKVVYSEGQRIHICEGPLKGFDGNVIKVDRHHKRITLRFDIAGNISDVNFSVEFLDSNIASGSRSVPVA